MSDAATRAERRRRRILNTQNNRMAAIRGLIGKPTTSNIDDINNGSEIKSQHVQRDSTPMKSNQHASETDQSRSQLYSSTIESITKTQTKNTSMNQASVMSGSKPSGDNSSANIDSVVANSSLNTTQTKSSNLSTRNTKELDVHCTDMGQKDSTSKESKPTQIEHRYSANEQEIQKSRPYKHTPYHEIIDATISSTTDTNYDNEPSNKDDTTATERIRQTHRRIVIVRSCTIARTIVTILTGIVASILFDSCHLVSYVPVEWFHAHARSLTSDQQILLQPKAFSILSWQIARSASQIALLDHAQISFGQTSMTTKDSTTDYRKNSHTFRETIKQKLFTKETQSDQEFDFPSSDPFDSQNDITDTIDAYTTNSISDDIRNVFESDSAVCKIAFQPVLKIFAFPFLVNLLLIIFFTVEIIQKWCLARANLSTNPLETDAQDAFKSTDSNVLFNQQGWISSILSTMTQIGPFASYFNYATLFLWHSCTLILTCIIVSTVRHGYELRFFSWHN